MSKKAVFYFAFEFEFSFFKIIAKIEPILAIFLNEKLTQLIYYPGLNLKMDPNSGEYDHFIKDHLGPHLNNLLHKHRNAHLFPEVLDGQVEEIDMIENDLQKLRELFQAKHEHMVATSERRKEYQEQWCVLRQDLSNEKQNSARLFKEVADQKTKIADLERELTGAQTTIAANVQNHDRLVTELKKKADERVAEAEKLLESMRERLSLERENIEAMQKKIEALQKCPPSQPPAVRRESPSGSMADIMHDFQIVMHGCTTLISYKASDYFDSMRRAPDYAAHDVAMYEGRFMSEVNALGNTLGSFCKEMGCPPLYVEDFHSSVNFGF